MKPEFIEEALREECVRPWDLPSEVCFKVHRLADLNLPSGRVKACDPFIFGNDGPFVESVPPGRYPVSAIVAACGNERRVAFQMLEISNGAVRTWRLADRDTGFVTFYGTEHRVGYGVDSGVGCFMDEGVVQVLDDLYEKNPDYHEEITEAILTSSADICPWVEVRPDPKSDLNIIIVDSGWGDGFYSSYLGLDKDGAIACIVTDFKVLDESKSEYWQKSGG